MAAHPGLVPRLLPAGSVGAPPGALGSSLSMQLKGKAYHHQLFFTTIEWRPCQMAPIAGTLSDRRITAATTESRLTI